MIVRQAENHELGRIDELFAIAFEQPLSRDQVPQPSSRIHNWAAFDEDGRMMSTFCVSDHTIRFDGSQCKMGGIGGVATLPEFRRRGGIRGCFNAALPDMYKNGYDFSYLYPFSTAYYRKFGYESCVQKLSATVDLGLLKAPCISGSFRLAEPGHPMTAEIRALDSLWEAQYNMMVIHSEKDYGWTEKTDPAATGEFTYVYFDREKNPRAYTTFRMVEESDGRNLRCSRFCFADKEGFGGLMALFESLSADHRYVKFTLPAATAMQYLCPEWSLGAARWTLQPGGMVRAVNVVSVLKKARYRGAGRLVLEIRDGQIPENNGRFAVSFEHHKAASVSPTDETPDAVLTIPTFSALIAGVTDFEGAAAWMDGLEVKNPEAALDRVFYRKDLMIVDSF